MKSSKKGVIIFIIIAVLFGYSQYALALQIGVVIIESTLLEEDDASSTHDIKLEFDNPSLLTLTAGDTEFIIYADDEKIGDGTLEPFVLSPWDKSLVDGTFQTESKSQSENDAATVKISGVTTYDLLFTSIDVPFIFYPSEEQASEFIHQN